ncbi:MAG: GIY-YIG nuclease family protein [Anaerolineae bacterium]|nr:GIY-YIG nuclease family protein [Anaerolineae bacterium]
MPYYVYILQCADDSYYTGSALDISLRLFEHQEGRNPKAYTYSRRPVKLVWNNEVKTKREARLLEHQIKGWNRKKKAALIQGDFDAIHEIVRDERKKRDKLKKENNSL